MKKCPKCGIAISDAMNECVSCHTKVIPNEVVNVASIDLLKPISKKEVINEINEDRELKIKELSNIKLESLVKDDIDSFSVPLFVKKVKNNAAVNDGGIFKDSNLISSIILVCICFLFVVNMILIWDVVRKNNNVSYAVLDNLDESSTSAINGTWQSTNNSLFSFNGNVFHWYEDSSNTLNSYYSGDYTVKNGINALEEIGYTEEEFKITFKDVKLDNVYSLLLKPTSLISNRKDVSKRLNQNEFWWLIMLLDDEGNASVYNKSLDTRYFLKRV